MMDENFVRLWKMRNLFEIPNKTFWKFYSFSTYLAVDEVIVLFKESVIFRQYIPKKHKRFGIKIYRLRDEIEYTYHMTVYSLLDGRKGISYTDPRVIHVNDILDTTTQVGRQDQHSTKDSLYRSMSVMQPKCCVGSASGGHEKSF
jgi:hypothetical protein